MEIGVAAFALLLAGYALVANRLDKLSIGPALAFVAVGLVLGPVVLDVLPVDIESSTVRHLAEVTLALVLFTDASTVDVAGLRRDSSLIGRLLGIGLLLTIAAGGLVATLIFPELPLATALLIGAILAPTDAALDSRSSRTGQSRSGYGASSTSRAGSTTASRRRSCSCSSRSRQPPSARRAPFRRGARGDRHRHRRRDRDRRRSAAACSWRPTNEG